MANFILHCVFILAFGNVINCSRMRSSEYRALSKKIKIVHDALDNYSSLEHDVASMKLELTDMKVELQDEKDLTSSLLKLLNVSEFEVRQPTKDVLQRVENLHERVKKVNSDHTTSYPDEINSLGIEMKKLKETNAENLSETYRFIREQETLIRKIQMNMNDTNNNLTKLETLTHQMETNLQVLQNLTKQQPDSYRKDIDKSTNIFRKAFLEEKDERKELEKRMIESINRTNDNISELEKRTDNARRETKHQLIILEKSIESQDCNRLFYNEVIYTAPEYQNNRNCFIIVTNKQLPGHVVQVQFNTFELEESADCRFDYLKLKSGEKEESPVIGSRYCGKSLEGRTIVTNGSSLRLEFKTDASVVLRGFQANISFVPKKCAVPEIKNGEVADAETDELVEDQTMIQINCKDRYEMTHAEKTADDTLDNTCSLGNWTRSMPSCTPKRCKRSMKPESSYWTEDGNAVKTLITAETLLPHTSRVFSSCKYGYVIVNNTGFKDYDPPAMRCHYGSWRNVHRCVPKIQFTIVVETGLYRHSSDNKYAYIDIIGSRGRVNGVKLEPKTGSFERGSIKTFNIEIEDIGRVKSVNVTRTAAGQLWLPEWMLFYDKSSNEYFIIISTTYSSGLLSESEGNLIGYFDGGKSAVYGGATYRVWNTNKYDCMAACVYRCKCQAVIFNEYNGYCNIIIRLDEPSTKYKNDRTTDSFLYRRLDAPECV